MPSSAPSDQGPVTWRNWPALLNRYHWFVFVVAALGWLFDTMDQQLFNLARLPAMRELLSLNGEAVSDGLALEYGGYATSIFLVGWALGGLFFGVLGDRIGRAKTMVITILMYSLFTGLSAFSRSIWEFSFYRFLTGLGVGGEFAVGVALVAEVMPLRARPYALGLLQALSAVGNITAALISIGFGQLERSGVMGNAQIFGITLTAWRCMFLVGTLPALLALLVRRRLKEPDQWQAAVARRSTEPVRHSYAELLFDRRWLPRAIVGLLLATSGVIGLWGIGFFSIDLNRNVFRRAFHAELRSDGQAAQDWAFLQQVVQAPDRMTSWTGTVQPQDLIDLDANRQDAAVLWSAVLSLQRDQQPIGLTEVLQRLDDRGQSAADRDRRRTQLMTPIPDVSTLSLDEHQERIRQRTKQLNGRLTMWAGITSIFLNLGAFFGIYAFGPVSQVIGRRRAFALSFLAAMLSTAAVFWTMQDIWHVVVMVPIMGFCQLSLFGGYAIYFPELFPTRIRSTGISFCYNVGRLVAAIGPTMLGHLTSNVFGAYPEPMRLRYAGITMCGVFLIGLLVLPFAPETKDQPLPD